MFRTVTVPKGFCLISPVGHAPKHAKDDRSTDFFWNRTGGDRLVAPEQLEKTPGAYVGNFNLCP